MKGIFNKLFLREETKLYLNAIQYLEYKEKPPGNKFPRRLFLARIFHKLPAATMDMAFLPGVLGCRVLRRTIQVRLGSNPLRLPGGKANFTASRRQFMKYTGVAREFLPFAESFPTVSCQTYQTNAKQEHLCRLRNGLLGST